MRGGALSSEIVSHCDSTDPALLSHLSQQMSAQSPAHCAAETVTGRIQQGVSKLGLTYQQPNAWAFHQTSGLPAS